MSPTILREARSFRPHFSRFSLPTVALAALVAQIALVGAAAADMPPADATAPPAGPPPAPGEAPSPPPPGDPPPPAPAGSTAPTQAAPVATAPVPTSPAPTGGGATAPVTTGTPASGANTTGTQPGTNATDKNATGKNVTGTPVAGTPVTGAPATGARAGEMLRWAGARFDWYHGVSLGSLGVTDEGPMGASDGTDYYAQTFAFSGGFFIVKERPHQLRVSTNINVVTELTDSDTTTRSREPQVNDIPLRLTYTPSLYSKGDGGPIKGAAALYDPTLLGRGDHRTWGLVTGEVRFPTSTRSQGSGRILSTSLGLGARQQLALLGADAPGLTHVILGLAGSWSHNFDRATTPVSEDLLRPRQSSGGGRILSDQISAVALVENEVGVRADAALSVYSGLQLEVGFSFVRSIPYGFSGPSGCEVQTQTGCIDLPQSERGEGRDYTSFDIGLSYLIVPELSVAFGYANTAYVIGEDGKTRDPFYSPYSIFYAGLSVSFDRFYQRFAEPENLAALLGEKQPAGTVGAATAR